MPYFFLVTVHYVRRGSRVRMCVPEELMNCEYESAQGHGTTHRVRAQTCTEVDDVQRERGKM